MTKQSERRRTQRRLHDTPITTKVLTSSSPSIAAGHTFASSSYDISEKGLCLRVNTPVHVGTELQMWVVSNRHKETLVLSGEVRWCLPVPKDPTIHQIGVELSQNPAADYKKWQKMVSDLAPAK